MKYRPYSRRELRSRFRSWLQRNWKVVSIVAIGGVALMVLETALLVGLGSPGPGRWYLLGVVHAAVLGAFSFALAATFLANDRKGIFHMRGAWGEENTRSELQRAKRKKLIWGWVDSVTLQSGDIDHLVVTRSGGLLAIDSKWRNQADASVHQEMARSAAKAKLRADGVMQTLLRRERGGHRGAGHPVKVRSVIVLWGAVQSEVPDGARIDEVEFIRGQGLVGWLKQLGGELVDKDAGEDLLRRIEAFRASAWSSTPRS